MAFDFSLRILFWIVLIGSGNVLTFGSVKSAPLLVAVVVFTAVGLLCLMSYHRIIRILLAFVMTVVAWVSLAQLATRIDELLTDPPMIDGHPVMDLSFLFYGAVAIPVSILMTYLVYRDLDRRHALTVAAAMIVTVLPFITVA